MDHRASRSLALAIAVGLGAGCPADPEGAGGAGGSPPGSGGAGGAPDECPDLSGTGSCRFDGLGSGCADDESCTIGERRCPGGARCCTLPLACVGRQGRLPGGARCATDEECATGSCLEVNFETSVCIRACTMLPEDSCPAGSHCAVVGLAGGASTRSCLGGEPGAEELAQTTCHADSDCTGGRVCRILAGEQLRELGAVGACLPPSGLPDDLGQVCLPAEPGGADASGPEDGSAACSDRGICWFSCANNDAASCRCEGGEFQDGSCTRHRCTRPCIQPSDCPSPLICAPPARGANDYTGPDWSFDVCVLPGGTAPEWGCRDDTDCCTGGVQRTGALCCSHQGGVCVDPLVAVERTVCTPMAQGGGWTSLCVEPQAAKALTGEPCVEDDGCQSGLCVAGAAGRICGSPCDPLVDRCGEILPGSVCCPRPWTDGASEHCVPSCRFDCPAAPDCTAPGG